MEGEKGWGGGVGGKGEGEVDVDTNRLARTATLSTEPG